MKDKLIHTPEGVRDIYGKECKRKRVIEEQLNHVFSLYHYDEIETPTFEFFDIFNGEKGTAKSNEMFKLFDRENNTLVLRPDMTPSIARCVAKYFANEKHHIRLCYKGQTFQNLSHLQGKLHEMTHMGAELIGDDTSAADGEMISMMVDCFLSVGLKDFQVSIGQVDYFRGLIEEAGLDEDVADELRDAISNKNAFAIETICKDHHMNENLTQAFLNLTNIYGGVESLEKAKAFVSNARSLKAIERLEKLYKIMQYYEYESYISFDLGMLSDYEYYTGVIFKGYTYGSGRPVATGGRYNGLLKQFGVDTPSVGFAILVDELVLAIMRQKVGIDITSYATMVLYKTEFQKQAIELARDFRSKDKTVQLTRKSSRSTLDEYIAHCKKHEIQKIIYLENSADCVTVYDVESAASETKTIKEIQGGAL